MLYMIIEHFKNCDPKPIGARFKRDGRMLPHGVFYQASWVDPMGARCFQIMEAPNLESIATWVERWKDLIDFEIIPVQRSSDFWSSLQPK
jgi:hypothetical protein